MAEDDNFTHSIISTSMGEGEGEEVVVITAE